MFSKLKLKSLIWIALFCFTVAFIIFFSLINAKHSDLSRTRAIPTEILKGHLPIIVSENFNPGRYNVKLIEVINFEDEPWYISHLSEEKPLNFKIAEAALFSKNMSEVLPYETTDDGFILNLKKQGLLRITIDEYNIPAETNNAIVLKIDHSVLYGEHATRYWIFFISFSLGILTSLLLLLIFLKRKFFEATA
jgi:hypothetical protein